MEAKVTSASDGGDLKFELQTMGLSVDTEEKRDDATPVSNTFESVFHSFTIESLHFCVCDTAHCASIGLALFFH